MQVVSPSSMFVGKERFAELYWKLSDDFVSKLKIEKEEEKDRNNHNENDDEDREEFSFASVKAETSPITADEAFENGHIRPVYPFFNRNLLFDDSDRNRKEKTLRSPLKKLFVETEEATAKESKPMGPYCLWSGRVVEEASPQTCRKSNSTGFSKLWRFRELLLRSNSDGKDAFVFLNNGDGGDKEQFSSFSTAARTEKGNEKTKLEKNMKTRSAHERQYMRNREIREEDKRRSCLPYKHVGFFTNVKGLTRNVLHF